jgi:predicted DNA-binding transcriptional regulator AlpA
MPNDTFPHPTIKDTSTKPYCPSGRIVEPLLVDARQAAALLSISLATFWRWDSSGTLGPRGLKRGGKRLWPMAELRTWVTEGCPDRPTWDILQANVSGRKW